MSHYSGITYIISNNGTQYADKIVPVNNSIYNLIDAHYVDWDSSQLTHITSIPENIFEMFANGESPDYESNTILKQAVLGKGRFKRKRYNIDPSYPEGTGSDEDDITDNEILSTLRTKFPTWTKDGNAALSNTAELLDIIDYLLYCSASNYNRITHLYEVTDGTKPVLVLDDNQIKNLGGMIDNDKNVSMNNRIKFTIAPNQTNALFKDIVDQVTVNPSNPTKRSIMLYVFAQDIYGKRIADNYFYYDSDAQDSTLVYSILSGLSSTDRLAKSLLTHTTFVNNIDTTDSAVSGFAFVLYCDIDGWTSDQSNTFLLSTRSKSSQRYADTINGYIKLWTPATSTNLSNGQTPYAQSDERTIAVEVSKDKNIFEYIYINDNRYVYFEEGFFNDANQATLEYKDRAFICKYDLLPSNYDKLTPDQILDLPCRDSLHCVSEIQKSFNVANDRVLHIKIYPKYFGDATYNSETNKPVTFGDKDLNDSSDTGVGLNLELGASSSLINTISKYNNFSDRSDSSTISSPYRIGKDDPDGSGIEREYFETYIHINQNISSPDRYQEILIQTLPSKYVSSMHLVFKLVAYDTKRIYFIDSNKTFNNDPDNPQYTGTEPENLLSEYRKDSYYSIQTSDVSHVSNNDNTFTFTWNLELPIFNQRSWTGGSSDVEYYMQTQINPPLLTTLKDKNKLVPPGAIAKLENITLDVEKNFLTLFKIDSIYNAGYPKFVLGFDRVEFGSNTSALFMAKYPKDKDNDGWNWVNISGKIEIDFKRTYEANTNFIKYCGGGSELSSSNAFYGAFKAIDNSTGMTPTEKLIAKGKVFVSRYLGLITEESATGSKTKSIVFYRTTIPDEFINLDYETLIKGNSEITGSKDKERYSDTTFKLVFNIPSNFEYTDNGNDLLYDEGVLYTNLMVTRASNDLTAWCGKNSGDSIAGAETKHLQIGTPTLTSTMVSSDGFTADIVSTGSTHTIQTRLTTPFIPLNNPENVRETTISPYEKGYTKIYYTDYATGESIPYYYNLTKGGEEITFYSVQKYEKTPPFRYRIDDNNTMSLSGSMDPDERFKGFNTNSTKKFTFILTRKQPEYLLSKASSGDGVVGGIINGWNSIDPPTTLQSNNESVGLRATWYSSSIDTSSTSTELSLFDIFMQENTSTTETINKVYNDGATFAEMARLSITATVSENEYTKSSENADFESMWNNNPDMGTVTRFMSGIYNPTNPYGSAKILNGDEETDYSCELNISSIYNSFYLLSGSTTIQYAIDEYFTFNKGKFSFKPKLIDLMTSNNKYKTLRLRVVGVLPMTDTYRGYVYDAKLIIEIKH